MAAIVDTAKIARVALYSLAVGIGVTAAFALAIASFGGMADAVRERRSLRGGVLGAVGLACLAVCAAAIVVGVVVLTRKS